MRKILSRLMILVFTIIFLVIGCQNLPSTSEKPNSNQITVKLSGWGASPAEQNLLKQVLLEFEEEHPHIKVKYEVIADQYMDVIKTRLIGEAAPDVFYLDIAEAPFLMSQNVLEPLDDYISDDFDLDDFEPNLLESLKYEGKIYGLPKDYSTLALFYNKKAFEEVGLTEPPQTWDDLLDYARKLTIDEDQDGRIDQYGLGISSQLANYVYVIEAFGGKLIDDQGYATFATEEGIQGLQLLVNQYLNDKSAAQPSDVGTASSSEMFGQGKAAMVLDGNWLIAYLNATFPDIDYGTTEVPTINGQRGTMLFTVGYVINKQSQNKQAAWELIDYLTGKEGMEKWVSTGFALPTRKSVAQLLSYGEDPLHGALVAGVGYGTPWQAGENLPIIMNSFNNQFVSALLGEQTLSEAMRRAQETANKDIKANE